MKGWMKLLVLGAVPILAVTLVADQALAADKGSQLIFRQNMAHQNFISIVNAHPGGVPDADSPPRAVTVLVQYYNDEMKKVAYYLRVIPGGATLLVDPFDHAIPGTAMKDDDGEDIDGTETNIKDRALLGSLPAETNDDDGPGINTGHFVIAVTAVGANTVDDTDTADNEANTADTANILFPTALAAGMDGTGNIDNGGALSIDGMGLNYDKFTPGDDQTADDDDTDKNVGGLDFKNAEPIAFNHLTGHFTEALADTGSGGTDQSLSWGGSPVIRPAVQDTRNSAMVTADYTTLNGMDTDGTAGGRLAEKDAGGMEGNALADDFEVSGYQNRGDNLEADTDPADSTADSGKIRNGARDHRVLNMGGMVLPTLHGGGDMTTEIMLLLSVSENYGAGKYQLVPAMTGFNVMLMDAQGDVLDIKAITDPNEGVIGGGGPDPAADSASHSIIVNGIQVMVDADLAKCTGTGMAGPWKLSSLTSLIPEAMAGGDKFAGLNVMIDPVMNRSPGWLKFARGTLKCEENHGDGDTANPGTVQVETPDGIPPEDDRIYTGGTLIVEEKSAATRTFVTTGRALLKFITPDQTFAASWTLKSPPSPTAEATETGDVSN